MWLLVTCKCVLLPNGLLYSSDGRANVAQQCGHELDSCSCLDFFWFLLRLLTMLPNCDDHFP